jgi:hypothetical protein
MTDFLSKYARIKSSTDSVINQLPKLKLEVEEQLKA